MAGNRVYCGVCGVFLGGGGVIFLILTITMALIGLIKLNTPIAGLTLTGEANHKRHCLIWIVLSIGLGSACSLLEFGLLTT